MKILRMAVAAAAVLSGTVAMTQLPTSALQFSYSSCIQIQNLSGGVAVTQVAFYNADGSSGGTSTANIPANKSVTLCPLSDVTSGFNGSAIISSDQQVAAVVNVSGNTQFANASYIGFAQGAANLEIPLLMKDNYGYNTWFKVQNIGSGPANISVTYSDGTTANQNNIAVGAAATFDQASETHSAAVFAATVSSSQPLVATVIEESTTTMLAYNAFTADATSTAPVMPLINANNYGFITGVQIKNGGGSPTTVTLSYTPSQAGTACTETQTIGAGQSATFALNTFTFATPAGVTSNCVKGATFIGSARVTANSANSPLTAIVNQTNGTSNQGEAYGAFSSALATNVVVMPLIMDKNYGWSTGLAVMNVGGSDTTVNCTFTDNARTLSATLAPGAALTDQQVGKMADGYVGAATCTAGAGGKIVGVVNEVNEEGGDKFMVYESITK